MPHAAVTPVDPRTVGYLRRARRTAPGTMRCAVLAMLSIVFPTRAGVVVNEIHAAPDVPTEQVEFIELHNPAATAADLSGWSFTDGIAFAFPSGTSLPGGGFLVVAQNPQALKTKFGVDALGPWQGRLSGRGERIELRDASRQVVDEVDYGLGFPWPTVGDAPGYSIELINPAADNTLGGHWRASFTGGGSQQTRILVNPGESWRLFKGTAPPPAGWRELAFDDTAWPSGPAPVGYDPNVRMGTPLPDMRDGYVGFFLRRRFEVAEAAAVTALALEVLYDDGFKLWLNGTPLLSLGLPPGEVPYTQPANPVRENDSFEKQDLSLPPGLLRDGENVLAIQVANLGISTSSDAFFDCRLRAVVGPTGRGPTPGRINSTFTTRVPPAIRQVTHTPRQPRAGEPVLLSAKVTSKDGIAGVSLHYQAVDPGNYIELTDPSYGTAWTAVSLNDAGLDGDEQAGDAVFTATLPGDLQRHRRLVRYRLQATDRAGVTVSVPYADDPQPNFAYFCYDGVPAWTGAVRPGTAGAQGQAFTVGVEEMNRLPVYHLVAKRQAVEDCTWYDRSHGDEYFWQGTLVYDGVVYDHIRFRPRGGVWRYAMGKNMWKFDFVRGHDFEPRDNWGRKLATAWTKLNLGACIQQGDFLHRGEQGLFESVGFRLFQLVGQPAMHTTFVQFRIIDAAAETVPTDQYAGDFWGLYLAIEQPDGRFLEEHALADGNFYKMEGGWGDPNHLGPLGPTDSSDLSTFITTYNSRPAETWWRANLNLRSYYGYQAIVQAIHHYDIADGKNYFYHREPLTGLWTVVPWDLDLTWADNMYRGGQTGGDEPFKSRVLSDFSANPTNPAIAREFRNRIREIRDLLWNQDETFRLIDEYARLVRGTNATSIIDADRAQWDFNPLMNNGSIVNPGKAGTGRFYQQGTPAKNFAGMVQLMKNYVGYRATNSTFSLDRMAAETSLPSQPTLTYVGPQAFPANRLRFQTTPFGGAAFGSIRWRIAEISRPDHPAFNSTEPQAYEITPTWESGDLTAPTPEFAFPAGVARVGHLYRVRARYTDTAGRASRWSPPVEFTAGAPDTTESLVEHLQLSELMYNPPGGSDFEYIELHNRSADTALDLGGARFTAGIDFTIPAGTPLAPGGYLLVTRAATAEQVAAFRARYGLDTSAAVLGAYTGSLANDGETLTLKTAANGAIVFSVSYDDGRDWPVAADGAGHSLIPAPEGSGGQHTGWLDYGGNWRASAFIGGSPGRADPVPPRNLILTELMAHTHLSDPAYPGYDSNDWIEVNNVVGSEVSLAGWYLSDDPDDLKKWALPGSTIAGGRSVVFDEISGFHAPLTSGFGLDQAGEQLLLSYLPGNAQDRVADAVRFKGQELDRSWGRDGDLSPYWIRLPPSPGTANPYRGLTVAISELMYRPWDRHEGTNVVDNAEDEYLELHNPTLHPIALYDTNGVWRLDGGIGFLFPSNTTLAAGGYLVVTPFDPADASALGAFRQKYGLVGTAVPILGPYTGKLGNTTDRVALEKPLLPDRAGEPSAWIVMEEVVYSSGKPWPIGHPWGGGGSLQRLESTTVGNNPASWRAGWPTPGSRNLDVSRADFDLDQMPDWWEVGTGLDPRDAGGDNGAAGDPDADGLTNLEEFEGSSDPRATTLRLLSVTSREAEVELVFNQPQARTIQIEAAGTLDAQFWQVIAAYPPQSAARIVRFSEALPGAAAARFFRVVSP